MFKETFRSRFTTILFFSAPFNRERYINSWNLLNLDKFREIWRDFAPYETLLTWIIIILGPVNLARNRILKQQNKNK